MTVLALAWAGAAAAQNFPPIAVAAAAPTLVRPGESVQFTGSGSSDPDDGPELLTHAWDFGDGTAPSSLADPTHAYTERGVYSASLTVFDGQFSSVDQVSVSVLEAPMAGRARSSQSLALSSDGATLLVVGEDAGTLAFVETAGFTLLEEVAACAGPVSVDLSPDDTLAFVSCRDAGSITVLDLATRQVVDSFAVGREPRGLVTLASGELLVALAGEGAVALVDPQDPSAARRIDTGGRPWALAVTPDGTRAIVTDFLVGASAGRVVLLDLVTVSLDRDVLLGPDPSIDSSSSGRGLPNLLQSVIIEPSGRLAHVGGLKSNVFRGLSRDGRPLRPTNRVRGLVAPIDLTTGLEREDWRFDLNDADTGAALALSSSGGRFLFVAHHGLGELSVYDVLIPTQVDTFDGSAVPRRARVPIGDGLRGLVRSGDVLYVHAALSRGVVAVDVADPSAPSPSSLLQTETETLDAATLNGKRMFFRSGRPRHSSEGYVACGSCHPGGGHDGVVWDFTDGGEGLRNTTDLRGRAGTGHGPVHWSANFDEIQDFENDIVNAFGGTGLAGDGAGPNPPLGMPNGGRGPDLDDLALFVASFDTVPTSPYREPGGGLSPEALRGKALFYSAELRCASCHLPPRFTDSTLESDPDRFRLHDVGTLLDTSGGRLGGELTGLDTPTLQLLWDGVPYLHDGRAATLREVLSDWNPQDRHGRTSGLAGPELDDLVAFLVSIDGGLDVLPDPATAIPGEVAPPSSPSLRLRKSGANLVLSWDPVDQAESYRVTRGELTDFSRHVADAEAGACDTSGEVRLFDPDDLADGAPHFYLATAFSTFGEGTFGAGRAPRTPSGDCS